MLIKSNGPQKGKLAWKPTQKLHKNKAWLYCSHDSHEMCLQDFEHLDHRDLVCIVSALEHNTWFNKLKGSGNCSKLSGDICDRIVGVAGKSVSLQEIHLPSIGVRWEFAAKLAHAMSSNPHCAIDSLDLSCNFIEDRGTAELLRKINVVSFMDRFESCKWVKMF